MHTYSLSQHNKNKEKSSTWLCKVTASSSSSDRGGISVRASRAASSERKAFYLRKQIYSFGILKNKYFTMQSTFINIMWIL